MGRLDVVMLDDEGRVLSATRRALESYGIAIHGFTESEEFYAAVHRWPEAVVLIDWNLKTCLGTDIVAVLRRQGDRRPMALISGLLDIHYAKTLAQRAGADAFIEKPWTSPQLACEIKTLSDLRDSRPLLGRSVWIRVRRRAPSSFATAT